MNEKKRYDTQKNIINEDGKSKISLKVKFKKY